MDGQVHELCGGPGFGHAVDRGLAAVGGAVVDDPEHAPGARVGLGGHDLLDEPAERRDPGLLFAAADQPAAVNIPGGEVAQRPAAVVVVLDALRAPRRRRGGRVVALAGLDLGLLISADHQVARVQQLAFPATFVEVEHRAGLLQEPRIAGKDPRAVLPRFDRVL